MPPLPQDMCEQVTQLQESSDVSPSAQDDSSWWGETKRLTVLSIPTIIIQSGLFLPQLLTASYVGTTLGVEYLDEFTLGNLTASLMTLSVLQGLFTAKILRPLELGTTEKSVCWLAIRGFVVCMIYHSSEQRHSFSFSWIACWSFVKQNPITSELATRYYRVLMLGLPFYVLYGMQWKFLAAQEIMKPLLIATIIPCALMPVLLRVCVARFGFLGAPLSLTIFPAIQALLLLLYLVVLKPHHPETWPGLKIQEALQ